MSWNKQLAEIWTKMVGPSRPTFSEIAIYQKYTNILKHHQKRRLKMLVLGSTPEFRDWGFEQYMDVTVIDYDVGYHNCINREIRHKIILDDPQYGESFINKKWQDMDFEDEFDLIVGDLVVGNVSPSELDTLLKRISSALKNNGLFLQKSFFRPSEKKNRKTEDILKDYYTDTSNHPYSAMTFDIAMNIIDDQNMVDFSLLYKEFKKLENNGVIDKKTMSYFENIGYDTEMKFKFHVVPIKKYEQLIEKYFTIVNIEYGSEVYSKDFPLYILTKGDGKIYGD